MVTLEAENNIRREINSWNVAETREVHASPGYVQMCVAHVPVRRVKEF